MLGTKGAVMLGLVAVALVALAVVSRNWSCRAKREPLRAGYRTYSVVAADGGALTVAVGLGRGRRTATLILGGIVPHGDPPVAPGDTVQVYTDGPLRPNQAAEGTVWSKAGCVQVAMLDAGLATTTGARPKWLTSAEWRAWGAAEARARAAKRGYWKGH